MSNYNYDSYCGIYCGACSILMAFKTGYKDKFASYWNDELNHEIKCQGCKTDTIFENCGKVCKIRKCAINRNMEHCIDCDDYPCNFYNEWLNYSTIFKLPHLKPAPNNLTTIKNVGVDQWLSEQDKKWKCSECQTSFSWFTINCTICGKDLEKNKEHESVFQPFPAHVEAFFRKPK